MFPSFSFRPGFLFDLLAPWLPSSSGVIARSSPARHSLGGAKGFRCVGGQLDCQIGRKLRGPRWVVWCRFSIGFRKIRFGLGSVDERQTWVGIISQYEADFIRFIDGQTISSRNFHISHPSFKAFKMLLVVLLLDSSKVCPAPTRLRWATVLPQQLLASLGALHVQAMDSACIGFTILHHKPLVQMKGAKQTSEYPENRLHSIQLIQDTSRWILTMQTTHPNWWPTDNRPSPMNLYSTFT